MDPKTNGVHLKQESNNNHVKPSDDRKRKDLLSVNNKKRKRDEFKYGNYHNYYYKRLGLGPRPTDLRLDMLAAHPEYFRNKSVLDIGCNSGFITINFAKQLLPATVLGIDIDGSLVGEARRELEKAKTEGTLSKQEIEALNHVTFRKANYILKDESLLDLEKPQYDAVLCLSVTKWVHLNFGDAGIRFLFKRIFRHLRVNGVLVLEAQAYETYKKRSKLNPEILQNYKSIELKPDKFTSYLLSEEVGFVETWSICDKEILKRSGLAKGFLRPLQVFIKR